MFAKLETFYRQIDRKIITLVVLFIILPIIILRLLGFLQPIELTAYDLLFHLSSREPRDERIVLVTWTESDIQSTEEDTISDRSLSFVLESIQAQQPRLIALDLYRDVPRASHLLSNQENKVAYNRLQDFFSETDNLMAIEKVRKPIIKTSKILSEQEKVVCSDVINDVDNYVRRAFIDCQPVIIEGDSLVFGTSFYLGTALGLKYLETEEWEIANVDTNPKNDSLKLSKGERTKKLEDLRIFQGPYIDNQIGVDFLINWRRNKKPFLEVSVSQINAESIRGDIFHDKIVIIGNIASSTADRHQIPITRWDENSGWVYGVYIPAHVASSIISAGLDNRPLIKMAPNNLDYWFLILIPFLVVFIIYRYRDLNLVNLFSISISVGAICTFLLGFMSLKLFQFGVVIPVVPSILGIWGSIVVVNNHLQFEKERESFSSLETFTQNLNHNLRATLSQIKGATDENINSLSSSVSIERQYRKRELKEKIDSNNSLISDQITLGLDYIERTSIYIERAKLRDRSPLLRELNRSTEQIARKSCNLNLKRNSINYLLKEDYDPALENELINYFCLEAVISNLLSNAFTAMNMRKNRLEKKYIPTICIITKDRGSLIEIIVEDNGVGISPVQQKKIFKPRTSFTYGQGIGLTIVKSFLSIEKGKISFKSQEGKGTKFTILIPKRKRSSS